MTVKQTDEQEGPAALTIYFAEQASKAAALNASKVEDKYAPAPSETEKTAVIDLKNLDYKEIWNKVKMMTGAEELQATPEEEAELKKLEQMRQQSDKDARGCRLSGRQRRTKSGCYRRREARWRDCDSRKISLFGDLFEKNVFFILKSLGT